MPLTNNPENRPDRPARCVTEGVNLASAAAEINWRGHAKPGRARVFLEVTAELRGL